MQAALTHDKLSPRQPARPRDHRRGRPRVHRLAGDHRGAARRAARARPRADRGLSRASRRRRSSRRSPRTLGCNFRRIQFTPDLLPSRHHRHVHPRHAHEHVRAARGPGVHERAARRRDQPRAGQDAVGAARGDAGAAGHDRGRDPLARRAVHRARDAEPDRAGGHLPAARGAGRPLPDQAQDGLPGAGRREAHARRPTTGRRRRCARSSARRRCSRCRRSRRRCSSPRSCSTTCSASSRSRAITRASTSARRRAPALALVHASKGARAAARPRLRAARRRPPPRAARARPPHPDDARSRARGRAGHRGGRRGARQGRLQDAEAGGDRDDPSPRDARQARARHGAAVPARRRAARRAAARRAGRRDPDACCSRCTWCSIRPRSCCAARRSSCRGGCRPAISPAARSPSIGRSSSTSRSATTAAAGCASCRRTSSARRGLGIDERPSATVNRGQQVEVTTTVKPLAAGYHVLHGAALTFGDALGLFDIEAFFPNPIAVKVFPRTMALRGQPVRAVGGALHEQVGLHHVRRRGLSGELRELREQAARAHARRSVQVHRVEGDRAAPAADGARPRERDRDDARRAASTSARGMRQGPLGRAPLDWACDATAALAKAAIGNSDRIGLVGFDTRPLVELARRHRPPSLPADRRSPARRAQRRRRGPHRRHRRRARRAGRALPRAPGSDRRAHQDRAAARRPALDADPGRPRRPALRRRRDRPPVQAPDRRRCSAREGPEEARRSRRAVVEDDAAARARCASSAGCAASSCRTARRGSTAGARPASPPRSSARSRNGRPDVVVLISDLAGFAEDVEG